MADTCPRAPLIRTQVSLIQSVNDSFQQAMQSKAGKEQFLEQMKAILDSLRGNLSKPA